MGIFSGRAENRTLRNMERGILLTCILLLACINAVDATRQKINAVDATRQKISAVDEKRLLPFRQLIGEHKIFETEFDFDSISLDRIMDNFNRTIRQACDKHLDKLGLMPPQTGERKAPKAVMLPVLIGNERKKITLAYRADNLYLMGFYNGKNQWYAFKNRANLIPGSYELEISQSYNENGLTKFEDLNKIPLSRQHVLTAIDELYWYNPLETSKKVLQRSVATLVIVTSEAARFTNVYKRVAEGWYSEEGTFLDFEIGLEFLRRYSDISCELLSGWDTVYSGNLIPKFKQKFRIEGRQGAIDFLHLVLIRGVDCENDDDYVGVNPIIPGHGK